MKQEEKDLLLKDLCARLPYGVKCLVNYTFCNETTDYEDVKSSDVDTLIMINQQSESYFFDWLSEWFVVDDFKPYLRPISSMTEEEKDKYQWFCVKVPIYEQYYGEYEIDGYEYEDTWASIDWLNENHFDYKGLIPMGLAIDATGLNIY